jgi:flavin-binding protein dodecin
MAQKITDVVGVSTESFAKAALNAVQEAAKTLHGLKWARVTDLEMGLDEGRVTEYRATVKIYFDLERK